MTFTRTFVRPFAATCLCSAFVSLGLACGADAAPAPLPGTTTDAGMEAAAPEDAARTDASFADASFADAASGPVSCASLVAEARTCFDEATVAEVAKFCEAASQACRDCLGGKICGVTEGCDPLCKPQ